MSVIELGNRVWQIYARTASIGTVIPSIFLSILFMLEYGAESIFVFIPLFLVGTLVAAMFSFPNVFILNLGLRYIYKNAKDKDEKKRYFIYLWLILCTIPFLILSIIMLRYGVSTSYDFTEILSFLIPAFSYTLCNLYLIFYINNKFDKMYPPIFSGNRVLSEDLLDDDF